MKESGVLDEWKNQLDGMLYQVSDPFSQAPYSLNTKLIRNKKFINVLNILFDVTI
jgi:hypothetical protein